MAYLDMWGCDREAPILSPVSIHQPGVALDLELCCYILSLTLPASTLKLWTDCMPSPARAEHIGSLKRPDALLRKRADFALGKCTQAELRTVEDECIADVVKTQLDLGLPVVTDGEFRRQAFYLSRVWIPDCRRNANLLISLHRQRVVLRRGLREVEWHEGDEDAWVEGVVR